MPLLLVTMALPLAGCAEEGGPAGGDGTWLRFDPVQCGGNPWDAPSSQTVGDAEANEIRRHYAAQGVTFEELERRIVRDAVPAVCGAPRDYRWYAQAGEDAQPLREDGWSEGPGPDEDPDVKVRD